MSVLVIGSSNTDLVVRAGHLPKPGETVLGGTFFLNPGGKGANQAVAAARLGKNITFCCKTGEDSYGKEARNLFEKEGLDTRYVFHTAEAPSGVALITVDDKAENCIVVASGANLLIKAEDIDRIEDIGSFNYILVQLEIPVETVEYIARIAQKQRIPLILNPAPACALSPELLRAVSIITPNETEAELLTGIRITDDASALSAAKALRERGPETVIITLGAKGSLIHSAHLTEFVPAFPTQAVDTTAAGDVFNGALAVGLDEGKSLKEAVVFATAASSIAVSRMGAQSSAPEREEVEQKLINRP